MQHFTHESDFNLHLDPDPFAPVDSVCLPEHRCRYRRNDVRHFRGRMKPSWSASRSSCPPTCQGAERPQRARRAPATLPGEEPPVAVEGVVWSPVWTNNQCCRSDDVSVPEIESNR